MAGVLLNHTHSTSPWYDVRVRLWDTINYFSLNDTFGYTARGIQKIVRRVSNRAGITQKVSPHVLRHTFAVTCIKKGLNTRYLQLFLGHDHLSTTEIYLNVSPEDACAEFRKRF